MNPLRQGAAWVYRNITLFALAVVVECFLAGLGIFRAMPAEDRPVSHPTFDAKFDAHADLGWFLFLVSLLLLVAILVAWTGPRSIGATFALAVLTFVQTSLDSAGEDAPVARAFHALNALLILALSWFLTARAWRGNLLIPPAQLTGTAPPPPFASRHRSQSRVPAARWARAARLARRKWCPGAVIRLRSTGSTLLVRWRTDSECRP